MDSPKYTITRMMEIMNTKKKPATMKKIKRWMKKNGYLKSNQEFYEYEDVAKIRSSLDLLFPKFGSSRVQLFINFKGGTGKSSISASYGYRLAEMGYKILIIDLDAQGHLSSCLGYDGEEFDLTLFDVLINKHDIKDCIISTEIPTLDLLPSNLKLAPIEINLMPLYARELRLRKALADIKEEYDLIVMDASPNMGLLNLNAILSADDLIIPALADYLSFHGLKLIFETLATIEDNFHFQLSNIKILINRYNAHFTICRDAREALETHYSDYLLETIIRQCTDFAKAVSKGFSIFQFSPASRGAEDINSLIGEILSAVPA